MVYKGNWRMAFALILSGFIAAAFPACAAEVRILDFDSAGKLVWSNDFTFDGKYHIAEASVLDSSWTTNLSGIQSAGVVVTQAVSITHTQRFFRVNAYEDIGAVDGSLWKAFGLKTNWLGGVYPWFYTNAPPAPLRNLSDPIAQSAANLPHDEVSWFGAYFQGPIDLSFWWKVSSEPYDYAAFCVDGDEKHRIKGDGDDWKKVVQGIPPGQHLVVWKYVKDDGASGGSDAAWVDAVSNTPRSVIILESDPLEIETDEDVPVTFDLDAYVSSGTGEWSIAVQADHGMAVTNGGSATNMSFVYTPDLNFNGSDSFVLSVASGLEFDQITVNVTVHPVDDSPEINGGTNEVYVVMDEDANPRAFALTLTAADPDTHSTNLLWTIDSAASSGKASVSSGLGTSQPIHYTPATNWNTYTGTYPGGVQNLANASYVTFAVRVYERGGGPSDIITVKVEIVPRNDSPVNTVPAVIEGTGKVGKTLWVSVPGIFDDDIIDITGTPTQYLARTYQWQRSESGAGDWTNIYGATGTAYELQGDDYDKYVRVEESAWDKGEGEPATQTVAAVSNMKGRIGLPDPGDLPGGMAFVPEQWVTLGTTDFGGSPQRTLSISSFFMDSLEVSLLLWTQVRTWALTNGYTDLPAGQGGIQLNITNGTSVAMGGTHPVINVNWYDCVKWCNARSEMEGKTPAYFTDLSQTKVYRTGEHNIKSGMVNWDVATGYRLPTEAEWEKAARGGLLDMLFPWGDSIGGSNANYRSSGDATENGQYVQGTTPVGYYNGVTPPDSYQDMVNGYGLYDAAGNVAEWCWDRYKAVPADYYSNDPKGSDAVVDNERFTRGGSWYETTPYTNPLRVADRNKSQDPAGRYMNVGFRTARGL